MCVCVCLTLSRECVVKVTCVCLHPCPPVLLQKAGLYLQQPIRKETESQVTGTEVISLPVTLNRLGYLWSRPLFLTNSCSAPT